MLLVALIPILLALPQLTPWLKANPLFYTSGLRVGGGAAIQRGVPYIDPNNGFQTQALGFRAAKDWIAGEVPWWNPYTGVGMPLAAEYQPSAFFPPTLLLLLPRGTVFLQAALHILAGLGAFALLRQLGLGRLAATTGGVAYAVNGTLAWFSHGPAAPVPFLPWFLYGIERAFTCAQSRLPGGWRILAAAMAMSLLAGFPETAYISGLLALAWAVLRGMQLGGFEARTAYGWRITAGGLAALAIASPQIVSFALYLRDAHVGGHAGVFAEASLGGPTPIMSLVAPYVMGPPMGYAYKWEAIYSFFGPIGGYVALTLLALAFYGALVRRDALTFLLVGWCVATLGRTFGVPPFVYLWNLIPGIPETAFFRYAPPAWELAITVLAAFAVDDLVNRGPRRGALWSTAAFCALVLAASAHFLWKIWPMTPPSGLRNWIVVTMLWAMLTTAMVLSLVHRGAVRAAAIVIAVDAVLMCAIPIASNVRDGRLNMAVVDYLRDNLGLQRFFTFEPIQPNYGAFFGIASINHNYLPVPQSWVDHVRTRLDRRWGSDAVVFNGVAASARDEFRANLAAYEEVGVKYVLLHAHQDFADGLPGVKQVYADGAMKIFQLPNWRPYFEAEGSCEVQALERRHARVRCDSPTSLLRRELFFPGWTATVNGAEARIEARDRIFQSVSLPAGVSEVRFRYAPPGIGWAWLAMGFGLAALVVPPAFRRIRRAGSA
jgi:hypothetical protein